MSWNAVVGIWEVENLRRLSTEATPGLWPIQWDYKAINPSDPATHYFGHATGPQVSGGREGSPCFRNMGAQIQADAAFQAACVEFVRARVIP